MLQYRDIVLVATQSALYRLVGNSLAEIQLESKDVHCTGGACKNDEGTGPGVRQGEGNVCANSCDEHKGLPASGGDSRKEGEPGAGEDETGPEAYKVTGNPYDIGAIQDLVMSYEDAAKSGERDDMYMYGVKVYDLNDIVLLKAIIWFMAKERDREQQSYNRFARLFRGR